MKNYIKLWNTYKRKGNIVPGTEFILLSHDPENLGFLSGTKKPLDKELSVAQILAISKILGERVDTKEQLDDIMRKKHEFIFQLGMEFLNAVHFHDLERFREISKVPGLNPNIQHPVAGWGAIHAIAWGGNWEEMKVLAKVPGLNYLIPDGDGKLASQIANERIRDKRVVRFLRLKERQQAKLTGASFEHLKI